MKSTIRSFIGAPIACSTRLAGVLDELGGMGTAVRPVNRDQIHLTVKFLGDIPWTQTAEISQLLSRELAALPAIEGRLKGVGVFPRPERPNVVWVGMGPVGPLARLASAVSDALAAMGIPREQRAFAAHLTLARVKARPPASLRDLVRTFSQEEFGPVTIDRVVLYQSELTSTGPVYTPLSEHPLAAV